jgi:hypothetical protein
MSTERQLVGYGQATFRRFVAALNRRDGYRIELNDADRPVPGERRAVLDQRLVVLDEAIDGYAGVLTCCERQLWAMA